ncbi:MAG: (2Fe-2S) ferredoxin domain-containing protein, partial [Candidatus Enteromonas sp.]|nr:(2Fe-2S) ferredoxin domain-containing protein [Candidatus Enteromonas sp.]
MERLTSLEALEKRIEGCSKCFENKISGNDGKRHVLVCGGTGCLSNHSEAIIAKLNELIAAKNIGDKVEVNHVGCFGFCSQGPFVKILPEDTLYRM